MRSRAFKRGMVREILMYVFSEPQPHKEGLDGWVKHFKSKGKYCTVEKGASGWVLLVEGEEADNSKHSCPEPKVTNYIYCNSPPPHAFMHFKYCNELCMELDRERRINAKENGKRA